jgi:hypothetical protein
MYDPNEDGMPLGFGEPSAFDYYTQNVKGLRSRKGKYLEYDEMDEQSPEFASAMDIYADNATRGASDGSPSLDITCDNPRAKAEIQKIITDLQLEEGSWMLGRDIAKYGERAEEIIVGSDFRIQRLKVLPTEHIMPKIDKHGLWESPAYVQVREDGEEIANFEKWQILFFANLKSRADKFGTGFANASRRPFKQLRMMEDAVVVARLTRAHNRMAYLVDTGAMTPDEAQKHLQRVKNALRKKRTMNPYTGALDLSHNPLSVEEDIFVSTNKESKADVKVLQGDLTVGNLADLEYFQQKIFTGLKVPKSYLQHEKDTRTRGIITEQDIQFARAVRRLQTVMTSGYTQLFDLGLLLRGMNPKDIQYKVALPTITAVDELRYWQTEQLKMVCAQMLKQNFWPSDEFVFTNFLGYDPDEVAALLKGQVKPDKFNGLYMAPKLGNTVTKQTNEEWGKLIASLPEAEYTTFMQTVEDLRMLTDWELEGMRRTAGDI